MATRRNPTIVDVDGVRGRIRELVFADDDNSTDVAPRTENIEETERRRDVEVEELGPETRRP